MAVDTCSIFEAALGEGDAYAARFASILNGADAVPEDIDDRVVIEEPDA